MYKDEVLTQNADGELAVRVVSADEAQNNSTYNDVFALTDDGKLALRTVGGTGGGGGSGDVSSVNGKKGAVVLTGTDINSTITTYTSSGSEETTKTITEHLQTLTDSNMTLQGEVDTNAGKTAELDADLQGKVNISQGVENAGKALVVGEDGNVTVGTASGGIADVIHDDTLTGNGTTESPLSVAQPTIIIRRF